ncbi:MAG TPA: DUF4422 domain-containing protein [Bacteroidales bacterium]|mgnify:CR=1 FL=1|nr:DUF4422 domain-containing protein [Bacteroidales bacterium]
MKIYVVGSSKNKFLPLDNIREKFLIDQKHEGDNIDFLNPWYCELTGIYYLWKHCNDDIVGLEHYRRYFVNDKSELLSENEIEEILKDHDVICACVKTPIPTKDEFHILTEGDDELVFNVLKKENKSFYDFLVKELEQSQFYWCNCLITNKKIFDEWCMFLFDLCIEIEKNKSIKNSPLRREGYVGEYLLGAWLKFNNYKIANVKMPMYDKELKNIVRIADV